MCCAYKCGSNGYGCILIVAQDIDFPLPKESHTNPSHHTCKAPHRYAAQEGDATMMTMAAALPGKKILGQINSVGTKAKFARKKISRTKI